MSQLLLDVVSAGFGKESHVNFDTAILRLHSQISFRIFIISSLLLTLRQIIGDNDISCLEDKNKDKDENLNAFCWIQSTYSIVELFHSCNEKKDCIYPGVGKLETDSIFQYHTYYQWTSAALFFHAVLFYIPRFAWKCVENGLQKTLAYDRKLLFYPVTSVDNADQRAHMKHLIHYFKTHKGHHQFYFFKYCCCELLGLVSVIVNMTLIELLLSNQFFNYGSNVISFWMNDNGNSGNVSPMTRVFPLVAKCTPPKRFGPGGNVITPDPICVLPLNSLNDKIFLFLWFYLIFVLAISVLALLYRLSTRLVKVRVSLLKPSTGPVKMKVLEDICNGGFDIGDWFVMYVMSYNMSKEFFNEFLEGLWEEMFQKELSV